MLHKAVISYAPSGITLALDGLIQPGDRILNPQAWGSWLEFAVPEATVAIDSRIELFPTQVWDDYVRISAGIEGWESILDRWGVTVAVVAAAEPGLRDRLIAAGWTETYVDSRWVRASTKRLRTFGEREYCFSPARVAPMTDQELDVVVLGGGGHVGLPLSLVLAKAGLRVGIYDTNRDTLDRIAARRDAVHGDRRGRPAP